MSIQPVQFRTAGDDRALEISRNFFHEYGEAMPNAAALLGGPTAHRRCLRLLADIAESAVLTRALKHELVWLHRLVMLDFVGDPEHEETACFMTLDIMDPRVDDLCVLADRFFDLLVAIADEHPACDVVRREIFEMSAA